MIVTNRQDLLTTWLCKRIGLTPTEHIKCIGRISSDPLKIRGVIGYDGYNGASVQMHVAGEGRWVSRAMLFAAFDYPFNKLKCNMVLGLVPSGNIAAIKFNQSLGFTTETVLVDAHPDGALILMSMRKDACRWISRRMKKEFVHG